MDIAHRSARVSTDAGAVLLGRPEAGGPARDGKSGVQREVLAHPEVREDEPLVGTNHLRRRAELLTGREGE
ncbi:hypothetical protein M3148_06945 [Georgenia satyanarayanai]|uniref:hypothetical protein n=1 Tax=Georgenia satyanarayanai TaxID=860221 RepID=UPI00203C0DCF|nr:hypothetical protein [Georgenia satyanarayanai]MCM3660731.1 hypothetical protein [Georgenia satyanarayanai]